MFSIIMYCYHLNFSYDPTLSAACHCLANQWAKVRVNWSLNVLVLQYHQASASDLGQFKATDLESFTAKQTQEFLDKLLQEQVDVHDSSIT